MGTSLLDAAKADAPQISADRRLIHRHPGTGFDIPFSVDFVTKRLKELGYDPQPCGKAGVVALAGGKKPGRVFMIRADMDALPIEEQSGVSFCSEVPGKMHACGHDMHTAMLLESAKLLKEREDEIQGTIKLMFQPAEEIFQGSDDMIRAGVLENPLVDAAMMIHVTAVMPFVPGTVIACDPGVSAAACDVFDITVTGKGCHGSMPNQGVDPITAACAMVSSFQEIHARELALSDEAVFTVGYFKSGEANNVIPDTARFGGTIRTFDEDVREQIKSRLEEMTAGLSAAYRVESKVEWSSGCPTLYNDPALAKCVPGYVRELLGENGCFTVSQLNAFSGNSKPQKGTASEDFAFVSQEVPSIMLALAAGTPKDGYIYPQHHPKVRFDEAALAGGSAVYAYVAMRWLEDNKE